jgi:hypothetical protein
MRLVARQGEQGEVEAADDQASDQALLEDVAKHLPLLRCGWGRHWAEIGALCNHPNG